MWVTITNKQGNQFQGSLENEPVYIRSLSAGVSVSFAVSNIAQILIPKTDSRWIDTAKKAVVSKRVFKERRVGFLYREKPHNDQNSGWVVWAGGEDDAFTQDSSNCEIVTLERLLEIDESIESLLNAEVGAVFERSRDSKEFQRVHDWKPAE